MRKIYLITISLAFCLMAGAQGIMHVKDKAFNFGGKVGFNATFPVINSLTINDKEVENVNIEYKVGYLAAIFCRVNIERFFIQPSISWHRSEGDIRFSVPPNLPEEGVKAPLVDDLTRLSIKTNSLELPVMIGYSLVKQGPYGLSLMIGPKLKYNYKVSYTIDSESLHHEYVSDNDPFGINIATGVGVSIGRLCFDFIYEFGLSQSDSKFRQINTPVPENNVDIFIDKRTNTMSISLGFLF